MNNFEEQVVLITGGAQGIGKGMVEKFAKMGAFVAFWDVLDEKAHTVEVTLKAQGLRVQHRPGVNVANPQSIEEDVQKLYEEHGRIDVLINNAGIVRDASLFKMTPEEWEQVIQINLSGVFYCVKSVATRMREKQYGRIVNISSVSGVFGNFGQSNYVAAKSGIIGMTKTWGRELGKYGICVNAIAPGPIETNMLATVPPEIIDQMKYKIAVKRLGQPEDIAHAAAFLCSPEAGFITGQTLIVDGGFTLGG